MNTLPLPPRTPGWLQLETTKYISNYKCIHHIIPQDGASLLWLPLELVSGSCHAWLSVTPHNLNLDKLDSGCSYCSECTNLLHRRRQNIYVILYYTFSLFPSTTIFTLSINLSFGISLLQLHFYFTQCTLLTNLHYIISI